MNKKIVYFLLIVIAGVCLYLLILPLGALIASMLEPGYSHTLGYKISKFLFVDISN